LLHGVAGLDNGLALTPPMGWRSWNCFHGDVDSAKIEKTIDAITARTRMVAGAKGKQSLADLGYAHVGVDDGWQACQTGKDCSFHGDDGTPLVNTTKFPDLGALVKYGEAQLPKVLLGWYQINCICCDEFTDKDNATWKEKIYTADVKQLIDAGFYGVKLDDCGDGTGTGLVERVKAINASGRALLIENSNQGVGGPAPAKPRDGRDNPTSAEAPCPFNLFRTGGDITADFGTVIDKLQRTVPYLGNATFAPISRPGCWAYPGRQ
jgi:alpha-galactosidase